MSVTFSIARRGRTPGCTCLEIAHPCTGCGNTYPVCTCDTPDFPWADCPACSAESINVSNANARAILDTLGLPCDEDGMCGSMRARDLASLCNLDVVDEGIAASADGRMVDCGRRRGYLNERMAQLVSLCERAGDLGVIQWG